ncbi:MAG: ComEC/Rec2 family competence protein [Bacteroidetes bacterium]|nr:ComEC/Rec2 family competence protein [Bacteroidota bacterium]
MNPWRPLPLLRLVFPFVAGIIAGQQWPGAIPALSFYLFLLPAWFALFLLYWFSRAYKNRWMTGSIILLSFFSSGFQLAQIRKESANGHSPEFDSNIILLVRVSDCPSIRSGTSKVIVNLVSSRDSGHWRSLNTKIYLTIYGNKTTSAPEYGHFYMLYGRPVTLKFFRAEHSFNFREYLYNKGVRYEINCRADHCFPLPCIKRKTPEEFAFALRDKLLRIFRDKGLDGQEFSVAAALLLGYVNEIDSSLKSAFAASGTMHILSVSGMHVGIIFLFLETILSFLIKSRYGIYLKLLVEILFIWAYAAVTGFSPAVLRAATCLSFLIAGKAIKRKPEMMNVISASVFFLLIMDPAIITDLGFQLSYLAVIGIVIMYKPIYDLYVTRYWLPGKIWALVAVSIAAQIATFPLCIYYFHRFPNYFILSNLIIVPLSNGIILFGILGLICSSIPILGGLAISALKLLLTLLNSCVLWIGNLPGAVSTGFFPNKFEVCLLYIFILSLFLYFTGKKPRALMFALSCLIILYVVFAIEKMSLSSHSSLYVYQGRQGYIIRYVRGNRELCFYSGMRMKKDLFIADQIGNERMACRVKSVQERWINFKGWQKAAGFHEAGRFGNMIIIGDRKIYLLEKGLSKKPGVTIHTDILLICNNTAYRMEQLKSIFSPGIIMNVSTASRPRVIHWCDQARKLGLKFYDLKTTGFYKQEL